MTSRAGPFRVGFVAGVMPDKWARIWADRMPHCPLVLVPIGDEDGVALLRAGDLEMCLVRLPVDWEGMHLIPLYDEEPVVVVSKEHPVAAYDVIDVAELSEEPRLQPPTTYQPGAKWLPRSRTAAGSRCRRCPC